MSNSVISLQNEYLTKQIPEGNRIIIDWVSLSTKKHTPLEIMKLLEVQDCAWELLNGGCGYQYRHYFGGISIHFCDDPAAQNGYIWLEMSGQGCRTFETYGNGNYEKLFELTRETPEDCRIRRLDVAFDDREGVLNIDHICEQTREENYTCRLKKYEVIYSNCGNATYFGSKSSNVFIRFYDKAKERGYDDPSLHWIRCELQLRDVNSQGFVNKLEDQSIQDLYGSVLRNYLCFRIPDEFDSNKCRWEIPEWWETFLNHAVAQSLYDKPGVTYNLNACTNYVLSQPIGSIQTLIEIHGAEAFIEMVNNAPRPKNPKYKRLIAEYRSEHDWTNNAEQLAEFLEKRVTALELERDLSDGYTEAAELQRMKKVKEEEYKRNRAAAYLRSQGLNVKRW